MCILFAYTLLKVVSHYYLSVLSMFKKKTEWGVGGSGDLYPVLFWLF